MGWTSEMVAETYKVSRQKQDEYALISHTRAAKVNITRRAPTTNLFNYCVGRGQWYFCR
jgi:Thiolase, N-terminal domain